MTPNTAPRIAVIAIGVTLSLARAGEGDRLQRALDWPQVDLAGYDRLYIEDVRVTDPKAAERKRQQLVESVPGRMANFIAISVDPDLFDDVERRSPEPGDDGLVLRVELTQYKPGSAGARFVAAGAGSAHLNPSS